MDVYKGTMLLPKLASRILRASSVRTYRQARHSSQQAKPSARWLAETRAALGRCVQFGLREASQLETAANAGRVLGREWRGLTAGPLGYTVSASETPPPIPAALTSSDVRWGDMDSMGHVNNTVYIRFAESSRLSYFRRLRSLAQRSGSPEAVRQWPGDMAGAAGLGVILGRIECDFLLPIKYPDRVSLAHAFDGYENGNMVFTCLILSHKHHRIAARLREVLPLYDYGRGKRVDVPGWLDQLLQDEKQRQRESKDFWIGVRRNLDGWVKGLEDETVNSGKEEITGV